MAAARTIEDAWRASKAHGNNFDALRLAAAFAVIVSHSFEIVGGPPESEPLRVLTNGDSSLGRVAVMTFFVLSGFLLTCSYRSDPSLAAFARKRALRIAPALAAVVLFSIFVIGFAATTLSPRDYFRSEETWRYLANLAFYTGFDSLPGVFADAPIAGVVNGPLWTLKIEVLCYATWRPPARRDFCGPAPSRPWSFSCMSRARFSAPARMEEPSIIWSSMRISRGRSSRARCSRFWGPGLRCRGTRPFSRSPDSPSRRHTAFSAKFFPFSAAISYSGSDSRISAQSGAQADRVIFPTAFISGAGRRSRSSRRRFRRRIGSATFCLQPRSRSVRRSSAGGSSKSRRSP